MNKLFYKKIQNIFFIATFLMLGFFNTGHIEAAIISFDNPKTVSTGDRFYLDILIDPENKSINSVEATITFYDDLLVFNGFSAKQSGIPIWIVEPSERTSGEVYFAGVVPGGIDRIYDPLKPENTDIPIVRLFFIAKKTGTAEFKIPSSLVLENNGKGTEVEVESSVGKIFIDKDIRSVEELIDTDLNKPNPFAINIIDRAVFGKNPKLAIFSTNDQEGGIQRYEASIGSGTFEKVTSPMSLPYRLFDYILTIKAFDFSGNFQEQQVTVKGDSYIGLVLFIFVMFASILIIRFFIKKKN